MSLRTQIPVDHFPDDTLEQVAQAVRTMCRAYENDSEPTSEQDSAAWVLARQYMRVLDEQLKEAKQ